MVSEQNHRTDTDEEHETSDVLQREVRGEQQYDPQKDRTSKGPVAEVKNRVEQMLPGDYPDEGTGIADV
jgi:hypothetical protein